MLIKNPLIEKIVKEKNKTKIILYKNLRKQLNKYNTSLIKNLHTPIILSLDPDAKYSPFGENTTLWTVSE